MPKLCSVAPTFPVADVDATKDRQLALSAGFQVHLAKPVEPNVLVEVIERLVMPDPDSNRP